MSLSNIHLLKEKYDVSFRSLEIWTDALWVFVPLSDKRILDSIQVIGQTIKPHSDWLNR